MPEGDVSVTATWERGEEAGDGEDPSPPVKPLAIADATPNTFSSPSNGINTKSLLPTNDSFFPEIGIVVSSLLGGLLLLLFLLRRGTKRT